MDFTIKRAKLPRKRKKAAIKAQGRNWYHNTIRMFYVLHKLNPTLAENICTFWRNDTVQDGVSIAPNGAPMMVPKPKRYW